MAHESLAPTPPARWRSIAVQLRESLALLAMAFGAGAIMILLIGRSPIDAYRAVVDTAFGDKRALGETLESATPLIFAGLALAVTFRARLLNLGAGGQFLFGALAAAWAGTELDLPRWIHVPVVIVAGGLAGALFALLPALLKAYRGVHEVISTIMLDYVGLLLINWLVNGPLQDPRDAGLPQTARLRPSAELPRIFEPSRLSAGLFVVVVVGLIVWWAVNKARLGYELRAVGANPAAAALGGISTKRIVITSMTMSGAIAGTGGAVMMSGLLQRYQADFNPGFGFTGLAIALLSRNTVGGVFAAGLLFGALAQGQRGMQSVADVPQDMVVVIQGFIIFFVSAPQLLRYFRGRRAAVPTATPPAASAAALAGGR